MYKRKPQFFTMILLLILIIFFSIMFNKIVNLELNNESERIKLYIETFGMLFTSLALILTYNSLKISQTQKNESVKPYLYLKNIDFVEQNREKKGKYLDFDYSIGNSGVGMARNISIIVRKYKDKDKLFEKSFVRLEADNDTNINALYEIRNAIDNLKNESMSMSMRYESGINDDFEIYNYDNADNYKKLTIIIKYYDIYGKKYILTTNVELDDDYDLENIEEKLKEY